MAGEGAHQIIGEAQAHGTGAEQELLLPVVTAIRPLLTEASVVPADAGYHREAHRQALAAMEVTALIADNDRRRRDERFATQADHHTAPDPLYDTSPATDEPARCQPSDVTYDNITGQPVPNTVHPFVAPYSMDNDPSSTSLSSRRMIFPEDVIGTESTNWNPRGTL